MPGYNCCVPNCNLNSLLNKGISFHFFPKNIKEKKFFVKAINRKGKNKMQLWQPAKYSKICHTHFVKYKNDFKHKELTDARNIICHKHKYMSSIDHGIAAEVSISMPTAKENQINMSKSSFKNSLYTCNTHDHNYFLNSNISALKEEISNLRSQIDKLEKDLQNEKKLVQTFKNKYEETKEYATTLEKIEKESIWDVNKIIDNQEQLQFYTGFRDQTYFQNFVSFIKPGYDAAVQILKKNTRKPQKLTFTQQFILVLSRLRLGLPEFDLAYRFSVSQGTVSNVWSFWVDFLCSQLTQVPIWPSKNIIQKYLPTSIKEKYPRTRIILDCTEIFFETPSNFRVQGATYSYYKSHNTAKGLLGISPNGMVTFVSDLYGGRTSDKEIFVKCGLLELLEEHDDVMADRGFLIRDVLEEKNVTLNIPPFLNGQHQFSEQDTLLTKNIANERIVVERVIKHVKSFKILKHIFPNSMSTSLNSIWKICSILVNFISEPVTDR